MLRAKLNNNCLVNILYYYHNMSICRFQEPVAQKQSGMQIIPKPLGIFSHSFRLNGEVILLEQLILRRDRGRSNQETASLVSVDQRQKARWRSLLQTLACQGAFTVFLNRHPICVLRRQFWPGGRQMRGKEST